MKIYGRGTVYDFLGDFIVYRNLVPVDPRLPPLDTFRSEVGVAPWRIPRKSEADYARTIVYLLKAARALTDKNATLKRLIFIGDTRLNDGTAFENICEAGDWPGLIFIGSETPEPPETQIQPLAQGRCLFQANRWRALEQFQEFRRTEEFPVDEATAVIVDLDKTALGARGRNAHVIDQARVQAVRHTVAGFLGEAFDREAFKEAYDLLNQVKFHHFTSDNQDYLAYISLVLGGGLFGLDHIVAEVAAGRLTSFDQFVRQVDALKMDLPRQLAAIHDQINSNVKAGDPTPFKAFRHQEYLETVNRMGKVEKDGNVDVLLANEIVLTHEVSAIARHWVEQGALLFGLSDKPDEASIPSPAQAAQGLQAIHRTETSIVGEGQVYN
jgi:hypothetical protein